MTGPAVVLEAAPDRSAVRALVEAATAADGVAPLSEPVLLDQREGRGRDWTATLGTEPAGIAHLDADGVAELVVHPALRRRGVGGALLDALEAAGVAKVWGHGGRPAALAFAAARGWTPERTLWQLRRPLADLPDAPLPAGITLRPFVPGQDEDAWVAVNAAAFAHHPEQGGWTAREVREREAEPWFDPAGFLLAVRADGALAGFHWTKVHLEEDPPLGEVYVLAVDPSARGLKLGPALTVAGLRHLAGRGLGTVLLYVDDDNPAAVRLYERLGFTKWDADVQFRRAAGSFTR
jgi:mycothiol synthase